MTSPDKTQHTGPDELQTLEGQKTQKWSKIGPKIIKNLKNDKSDIKNRPPKIDDPNKNTTNDRWLWKLTPQNIDHEFTTPILLKNDKNDQKWHQKSILRPKTHRLQLIEDTQNWRNDDQMTTQITTKWHTFENDDKSNTNKDRLEI